VTGEGPRARGQGTGARGGLLRKHHEAAGSTDTYSPAEEMFNRRRRTIGLFAAPIALLALLLLPLPVAAPAHRLSAILAMMVILWVTEALPLAVTALIGPILAIVLRVAPARAALAPFADPIIFLFIGSFMLAEAMFVHGLDRRIAFGALSSRFVGSSPARILIVYGGVAAFMSMWISNTATTAMMFPIGLSIVSHLTEGREVEQGSREFATAMMLMAAFGASVGGIGTPIGTPPNLIGIGMLSRISGVEISFFTWMMLGVPVVILLFLFLSAYFYVRSLRGVTIPLGRADHIQQELRRIGPLSPAQRNVLIAFGLTASLWILPGVLAITGLASTPFARGYAAAIPEAVAAMIGAILLFVLPVSWRARRFTLTWEQAVRIDWGIVLLFGGGLTMGELAFSTGLAEAMGRGITSWLPATSSLSLIVLFTAVAIVMSEAASNTASANMVVPIAIAVALAAGVPPLGPALGATLGASMGFMMPISTPPNAIVYSSGYVPITSMMKHGFFLDVAGFIIIVVLVTAMQGLF
jgi:solute carrier family 13 (sodium-dependent dicarboxylate transporter), member 2/3/5